METLEEFTERLYRAGKYIPTVLRARGNRINVDVIANTGESLMLRAVEYPDGEFEISLSVRGNQLVRKWHNHDCHRNPGGAHVPGPHEHYPTNKFKIGETARLVDDMPDDFYDAILAFLSECNIQLSSMQRGLYFR